MLARTSKFVLPKHQIGKIVEWNNRKGFGFLQLGNARVFLHRREFAQFHKTPELGDQITFSVGLDKFGRTCAKKATHFNDGGVITLTALLSLLFLLIPPAIALTRSGFDLRVIAIYAVGISIL